MAGPVRRWLDSLHPQFAKGGKYEKYYAVYEAVDTFIYSPPDVARGAPHVRDAIDLKRIMIMVWVATFPVMFMACWNTGYQANMAMAAAGADSIEGWRASLIALLGGGFDPASGWDNFTHGLWYFLPIYAVTFMVGGFWEVLFAAVRNHEVNEGFFVTSILFTLTLPPTTPLWMVAMGISFGVVVAKEMFGGTGKNFVNPALAGRAFLFFAYPAAMSGDAIWTAFDGFSGATPLGIAATEGLAGIQAACITWQQTFFGSMQGSLGETSTLAILISGVFLVAMGIASHRIILGVLLGMIVTTYALGAIGNPETNPMFTLDWMWHLTLGGLAFGMVFMATDPVSASMTHTGRWIFGALIGFMVVLISVVNPAFPEGMMLAILFANLFAPLIDYFVMQANIRRRASRTAA